MPRALRFGWGLPRDCARSGGRARNLGKNGTIFAERVQGRQPTTAEDPITSPHPSDLPRNVVDEGSRFVVVLPAEPRSAQHARSMVLAACNRWHAGEVCADTELVVTELVANAVRHAGTEITIRLASMVGTPGGVRAEVSDCSTRPVRPRRAGGMEESGRGLFLVDMLSSRWGATANKNGKTIWAEIVPDLP